MSFTIAKMLQLPAFRGASVLAGGKGVGGVVDGVTLLESTDFHNAVMKGKLVLTSSFFLDLFRESGVNYVLECYKRHAVALCVKEGAAEQSLAAESRCTDQYTLAWPVPGPPGWEYASGPVILP